MVTNDECNLSDVIVIKGPKARCFIFNGFSCYVDFKIPLVISPAFRSKVSGVLLQNHRGKQLTY